MEQTPSPKDQRPEASAATDPSVAGAQCGAGVDPTSVARLRERVSFLASRELGGRTPGTAGDVAARRAIEEAFRCFGLEPGADDGSYQQAFVNSDRATTANVIGILRGSDKTVGSETILLAAHHDHFGTLGGEGLRLGANDNASGTAGLLAVAEALAKKRGQIKRTIAFIAFGAEETLTEFPYDEGSAFYVSHPAKSLPVERIVHVTTLDMIGSYDDTTSIEAMGSEPGTAGRMILEKLLPEFPGLEVKLGARAEAGDSDFDPFCRRGVPYVGFYTEDTECYHQACDTADRLDYPHMSEVVKLTIEMTLGLADGNEDLAETKARVGCTIGDDDDDDDDDD